MLIANVILVLGTFKNLHTSLVFVLSPSLIKILVGMKHVYNNVGYFLDFIRTVGSNSRFVLKSKTGWFWD